MDGFEKIEKALGVDSTTESTLVTYPKPGVVAIHVDPVPLSDDKLQLDLKADYDSVRKNLKELVEMGKNSLDGVIAVAQEGDSPRAYEVVALMIKTLSDTNRELLDLHNRIKTIRRTETTVNNVSNTSQSIYVGSTKELQDIINSARSYTKAFGVEVVDVEVENK